MTPTTRRAMAPEDLLALSIITDARLSPDGSVVAYVMKQAHVDRNEYSSAIFFVATDTDGAVAPRQITTGLCSDTSPRWSPDGRHFAFLSDRSGTPHLYVLDLEGGEPRQVTTMRRGVATPEWSPDGTRIAFLSTEGNGIDDEVRDQPGGMIRNITRRQYRFDDGNYIDDRFQHVWIVDVDTGATHQLTWGEHEDRAPTWSPDGGQIGFVRSMNGEVDVHHRSYLCVIDAAVSDSGKPNSDHHDHAIIVSDGSEMALGPSWSPDGQWIAFIGRRVGARAGANSTIFLSKPDGSAQARNLTAAFDRNLDRIPISDAWRVNDPRPLWWMPDSRGVHFTAADRGQVGLYQVDLDGGVQRVQGGERTIAYISASEDGQRFAYVASDFTEPCDVYTCLSNGTQERRLTAINAKVLDQLAVQRVMSLPHRSFDDRFDIDAWLVRPWNYEPGEQYPLILIIHGGPHALFGYVFFFDMQLWAGQGWNVLFVNPRASHGYGEEFATSNTRDWGGADWRDLETAVDHTIELGGVDGDRLGVTGLSYGGYMTNWIIGQTSRYRAAVSENGVSNIVSHAGTSTSGWYLFEHGMEHGQVWENLDYYMERSPISYVTRMATPLLLLQGETDLVCPIEQGEQLYTALQVRAAPCELVRFPGEGHLMQFNGRPESRLERREHTLRWFRTYL